MLRSLRGTKAPAALHDAVPCRRRLGGNQARGSPQVGTLAGPLATGRRRRDLHRRPGRLLHARTDTAPRQERGRRDPAPACASWTPSVGRNARTKPPESEERSRERRRPRSRRAKNLFAYNPTEGDRVQRRRPEGEGRGQRRHLRRQAGGLRTECSRGDQCRSQTRRPLRSQRGNGREAAL
jgi:hypothetical protein